ncbi:TRADD-N-associated membrane domain-containing protein [Polaromonas naphthalenivorans]|uniref:Cyanobacterial TRADD-N associated 2 transmembrane domain-containing protein n=1 Tax=Polaromonas naphthalenivorans (strain CJ2) TaxID=365044 RepID=A1VJF6_POLNA|nr:hypothetical protein [Polaromonas naphthalenivorans]ABM35784.1 hypothetical protein Pnap_0462 [Polaromonas naphthalenivorans CJ2]
MKDETVFAKEAEQEPPAPGQRPEHTMGTPAEATKPVSRPERLLRQLLLKRPKIVILAWAVVVLVFLLLLPLAYLAWFQLPGRLWAFANEQWWHWIPAFLGFIAIVFIPLWAVMGAIALAGFLADISLSIEHAAIQDAQRVVRETEQDAISRLELTDVAGLLPLLKYSRAQLDAYYAIGLNQTRKSFFNAVLAMWLGFILLLIGIALYVGPVEKLGLTRPQQDFQILILSGAAIIEFVSALFLWVYRSTTAQLTYYYKRQMHSHTSILCFRMATTIQTLEKSDEIKKAIIEKVLDWNEMPERPPLVGAKGLRSLLPASEAKATP